MNSPTGLSSEDKHHLCLHALGGGCAHHSSHTPSPSVRTCKKGREKEGTSRAQLQSPSRADSQQPPCIPSPPNTERGPRPEGGPVSPGDWHSTGTAGQGQACAEWTLAHYALYSRGHCITLTSLQPQVTCLCPSRVSLRPQWWQSLRKMVKSQTASRLPCRATPCGRTCNGPAARLLLPDVFILLLL